MLVVKIVIFFNWMKNLLWLASFKARLSTKANNILSYYYLKPRILKCFQPTSCVMKCFYSCNDCGVFALDKATKYHLRYVRVGGSFTFQFCLCSELMIRGEWTTAKPSISQVTHDFQTCWKLLYKSKTKMVITKMASR